MTFAKLFNELNRHIIGQDKLSVQLHVPAPPCRMQLEESLAS
ncbi:hypothetical protein OH492_02535 [Vibrio chagasii]|nr:hypothetical protein [Vibrio chagasii]